VLRWGRYGRRAKLGPDDGAAGFDNSILPWLKQRDIAMIVWETAGYSPQPQGDLFRNAVHNFVQAILGIHILDRADLEALSEATASRNRWEFMLTVTPLALPERDRIPSQSDRDVLSGRLNEIQARNTIDHRDADWCGDNRPRAGTSADRQAARGDWTWCVCGRDCAALSTTALQASVPRRLDYARHFNRTGSQKRGRRVHR
jgi:hypothetical protein